jgi:pyruvate/2-oxoglutarate dehydrogenase complex dihydrolipoamide acyltransferase (E2) component
LKDDLVQVGQTIAIIETEEDDAVPAVKQEANPEECRADKNC